MTKRCIDSVIMTAASDRDSFDVMVGVRGRQGWIGRLGVEKVEKADDRQCTYQPSCEDDRKCCAALEQTECAELCRAILQKEQVQREEPEVSNKASGLGQLCLILEVISLKRSCTGKKGQKFKLRMLTPLLIIVLSQSVVCIQVCVQRWEYLCAHMGKTGRHWVSSLISPTQFLTKFLT